MIFFSCQQRIEIQAGVLLTGASVSDIIQSRYIQVFQLSFVLEPLAPTRSLSIREDPFRSAPYAGKRLFPSLCGTSPRLQHLNVYRYLYDPSKATEVKGVAYGKLLVRACLYN